MHEESALQLYHWWGVPFFSLYINVCLHFFPCWELKGIGMRTASPLAQSVQPRPSSFPPPHSHAFPSHLMLSNHNPSPFLFYI